MTEEGDKLAFGAAPSGQTVAQALALATERLREGLANSSPRLDAEILLSHLANWSRAELHCRINDPIPDTLRHRFWEMLKERERGVPVAYLLGWKEFYSRRFWVQPGILVPRPETEILVEKALALLRHSPGATRVLDLCCGSGCIGITICLETLNTTVVASDISHQAVEQTAQNIRHLGVEDRVEVLQSDLFEELPKEAFDLIVSNPPYVGTDFGPAPDPEVASHEPSMALFSGRYGTDHIRSIVERAPSYLIEGGSLIVECAPFQAEKVEAWMTDRGFNQTSLWHDLSALPRGVSGRWEG